MSTDKKVSLKWIVIALLFVTLSWLANWYFLKDDVQRGTLGDMFGVVNALFSGLAFVGIVFTIFLQSKELELQRQELKQTRFELQGQKEQMEQQNKTLTLQRFESTFFQMLNLHNEIVSNMNIGQAVRGRDCFGQLSSWLDSHLRKYIRNNNGDINGGYLIFFESNQHSIGHYFRNLYHIIKFIDKSNVDDRKFYTNLVRAQLSSSELVLIFYNCLSSKGDLKFKPLVEKYALLKTMPTDKLIHQDHKKLYQDSAFN